MTAASIRPTPATQASLPPADNAKESQSPLPKENDKPSISITQIAIPIIIALASFLLLPMKIALIITAAVTIGAIAYYTRYSNKSPQAPPDKSPNEPTPTVPQNNPSESTRRQSTTESIRIEPSASVVQSEPPSTNLKKIFFHYSNGIDIVTLRFQSADGVKHFLQTHREKFGNNYCQADKTPELVTIFDDVERKLNKEAILRILEEIFGKQTIGSLVKK
jgi:hypothetical protein